MKKYLLAIFVIPVLFFVSYNLIFAQTSIQTGNISNVTPVSDTRWSADSARTIDWNTPGSTYYKNGTYYLYLTPVSASGSLPKYLLFQFAGNSGAGQICGSLRCWSSGVVIPSSVVPGQYRAEVRYVAMDDQYNVSEGIITVTNPSALAITSPSAFPVSWQKGDQQCVTYSAYLPVGATVAADLIRKTTGSSVASRPQPILAGQNSYTACYSSADTSSWTADTYNLKLSAPVGGQTILATSGDINVVAPAASDKFTVGPPPDRVTPNRNSVAVRSTAGSGTEPIDSRDIGELGTVIGGPTPGDNYVWWKIDWDTGQYNGWSREDFLDKVAPTITFLGTNKDSYTINSTNPETITITWRTNLTKDNLYLKRYNYPGGTEVSSRFVPVDNANGNRSHPVSVTSALFGTGGEWYYKIFENSDGSGASAQSDPFIVVGASGNPINPIDPGNPINPAPVGGNDGIVFAAGPAWQNPPPGSPPENCNDHPEIIGCNPPINVSSINQIKRTGTAPGFQGGLSIGPLLVDGSAYIAGVLRLPFGAQNNFVLTSDDSGNATWQPGGPGGGVTSIIAGDNIVLGPSGANGLGDVRISSTGGGSPPPTLVCNDKLKKLLWSGSAWSCGDDLQSDNPNSLPTCSTTYPYLKWDGTSWVCVSGGTGDITSVQSSGVKSGLTAKSSAIVDGDAVGGTISAGDAYVSLRRDCANGKILKWKPTNAGGEGWECANDNTTGDAGGVTSVGTSGGLTGGTITTTGVISIADGGVTTAKIAKGSDGQVLTTWGDPNPTVQWRSPQIPSFGQVLGVSTVYTYNKDNSTSGSSVTENIGNYKVCFLKTVMDNSWNSGFVQGCDLNAYTTSTKTTAANDAFLSSGTAYWTMTTRATTACSAICLK